MLIAVFAIVVAAGANAQLSERMARLDAKLNGVAVEAVGKSAPLIGITPTGSKGGSGHSKFLRLFLAALIGLFPKRNHESCLPSSKSHSSCWSYKVESSGARIAPEHSATAVFPAADRFFRIIFALFRQFFRQSDSHLISFDTG